MLNNSQRANLVKKIIDSPKDPGIVLYVAGGGTQVLGELLRHGGASSIFLEGLVPYSQVAFERAAGKVPNYCGGLAARRLAKRALMRSISLRGKSGAMGIGVVASLAKAMPERKGRKHHFHMCIHTTTQQMVWSVVIEEELERNRLNEEQKVADFVLERLYNFLYNELRSNSISLIEQTKVHTDAAAVSDDMATAYITNGHYCTSNMFPSDIQYPVIFPGSYNPIHPGHMAIVQWASENLNRPIWLEISIDNVDKSSLDYLDLQHRQLAILDAKLRGLPIEGVMYTHRPKFLQKTFLYNKPIFLVGSDTYSRIVNQKYYESAEDMANTFEQFRMYGVKFYVFPRPGYNYDVPSELVNNTIVVHEFEQAGHSSTGIRQLAGQV